MSRDALIVGINHYDSAMLQPLRSPAQDADAIAESLETHGSFRIWRLPEFLDPFAAGARRVARHQAVTVAELEEALVRLFKPPGQHVPETALFFFSGHGLRKDRGIQEGYLATSDVNPAQGNWGLSLQWLRRLLQESLVPQQIVWLDCCYSGEALNFNEADPGRSARQTALFLIAASREFDAAYVDASSEHSLLTSALLEGLNPHRQPSGLVTNDSLVAVIQQRLRREPQQPLWLNPNQEMVLAGTQPAALTPNLKGECPYRGLRYFRVEDAPYFYGREALTAQLLDQVKVGRGNFLAVLGASGSGKSSAVRAGLIYQLQQGRRLSGSEHWQIRILTPGGQPLTNLAAAFLDPQAADLERAQQLQLAAAAIADGAAGLARLVQAAQAPRTLLFVDQFEEIFTLCQSEAVRQQFLACLLEALAAAADRLCLVIAMRADFLGRCTEQAYSGLADKIQTHLVTVKPMTAQDLTQVVRQPAQQVGLRIEDSLVTQILNDLSIEETRTETSAQMLPAWEPGSLPLLEYTLEQLWRYRSLDRLTLDRYIQLGGVRKALEKRADEVYQQLQPAEQQIAKQIFLALTQLGEGVEDTRRRVFKADLIHSQQSAATVDRVVQALAAERLVVTSELMAKGPQPQRAVVVEIAHEALIRHWRRLRLWLEDNRDAIRLERKIEAAAQDWQAQGRPQAAAYLLQGPKLAEAESFLADDASLGLLSGLAQAFIQASQQERDRAQQAEAARRQRELAHERQAARAARRQTVAVAAAAAVVIGAIGLAGWNTQQLQKNTLDAWTDAIAADSAVEQQILQAADRQAEQYLQADKPAKALAYYRRIREASVAALSAAIAEPQTLQQLLSPSPPPALLAEIQQQPDAKPLFELAQQAEAKMMPLVQTQAAQLTAAIESQDYGQLRPEARYAEREAQYTGALRETYALLMLAAGADLNGNGRLDSLAEALQIPCPLLDDIEQRWRAVSCSWYADDPYVPYDPSCQALNEQTLALLIFNDLDHYPLAVDRLAACRSTPSARQTLRRFATAALKIVRRNRG
ncbi:MAG: hypothetical protein F6J97_09130 [Leptolyngbya sp. SIO4C1]|nr:hypothetical protein [Leptolyngbya sp. SIO4C1]